MGCIQCAPGRLNTSKERKNKLEDRAVKVTQPETQREKRLETFFKNPRL